MVWLYDCSDKVSIFPCKSKYLTIVVLLLTILGPEVLFDLGYPPSVSMKRCWAMRTFPQKKWQGTHGETPFPQLSLTSWWSSWSIHSPWASPAAWCMERKSSARHMRAFDTWNSLSSFTETCQIWLIYRIQSTWDNRCQYISIVMKTREVSALHSSWSIFNSHLATLKTQNVSTCYPSLGCLPTAALGNDLYF